MGRLPPSCALFSSTFPSQDLYETDYYDASGTLVRSFVTGPLIANVTNLSSGRSAVRSESGPGWFYYHPDGSLTIVAPEHIGVGFHAGDSPSNEFLIFSGRAQSSTSRPPEQRRWSRRTARPRTYA